MAKNKKVNNNGQAADPNPQEDVAQATNELHPNNSDMAGLEEAGQDFEEGNESTDLAEDITPAVSDHNLLEPIEQQLDIADSFGRSILDTMSGVSEGVQQVAYAPQEPKKNILKFAIYGAIACIIIGGAIFGITSMQNTAEREQFAALQAQQLLEAQEASEVLDTLSKYLDKESAIIKSIRNAQKVNANNREKWNVEWEKRQKQYEEKTDAVQAFNEREDEKAADSVSYDYWGYSMGQSYEPEYKEYPDFPNQPKKVTVNLAKVITQLSEFKDLVDVATGDLADVQSLNYPNFYSKATSLLDSFRESAREIEDVLDKCVEVEGEQGDKIDAQKIAPLSSRKSKALLVELNKTYEEYLLQYDIDPADVGREQEQ